MISCTLALVLLATAGCGTETITTSGTDNINSSEEETQLTTETGSSEIELTLEVGESQSLAVETNYEGTISYRSTNETIFTVDENGTVTAVGAGSAKIEICAGSVTKRIPITVTEKPETETEDVAETENETTVETSGSSVNASSTGSSVSSSSNSSLPAGVVSVSDVSAATESTQVATTTEASTECEHTWEAVYTEVCIAPEYQNPIQENHTFCSHCGYDYTANGLTTVAGHICPDGTTGASYNAHLTIVGYETIPALYEEVIDHYVCTKCGVTSITGN